MGKRWRIDAVTYELAWDMSQPEEKRLVPLEVGRIPGGRLYRWRRSAKSQAEEYDKFHEWTKEPGLNTTTQYEVVDVRSGAS